MNDQWTDRLSEYLDGELPAAERNALESHLPGCARCRAVLADLRGVVARAQALEDRPPETDLWPGIRAQLTRAPRGVRHDRPGRRRFIFTAPQLLAASIALVLLSGGGVWVALHPTAVDVAPAAGPPSSPQPGTPIRVTWTSQADQAVAELQEALLRTESRLDTGTVRVVRQNLAIIDRAIAEARAALQRDPRNRYLNLHLANTMRRKVELLRRINALVAES